MSRYIKLDDAIDIVTRIQGMRGDTLNALCDVPGIDLVLCKDCRYYRPEFDACTADGWNLSATHYPKVHESGYCYRRKRRSDE